jgi:hypothetical protein
MGEIQPWMRLDRRTDSRSGERMMRENLIKNWIIVEQEDSEFGKIDHLTPSSGNGLRQRPRGVGHGIASPSSPPLTERQERAASAKPQQRSRRNDNPV